jgi:hypothetical protein
MSGDCTPPMDPIALPAREAARLVSISPRALWAATCPRGDLPCVRLGGRVLYRPEDLRAWIASRVVHPEVIETGGAA